MEIKKNKIKGSLIGGAIGDALGYPIEFMNIDSIKNKYGENGIREYELNDNKALISDDTQMTLFTLNGLIFYKVNKIRHLPESVIWKAYLDWYYTQDINKSDYESICWISKIDDLNVRRAPGNTCLNALSSGCCGTLNKPINDSKGCGGVMRIAPVGLFYKYDEYAFDEVCTLGASVSAITHGHILSHISSYVMTGIINLLTYTNMTIEEAINRTLEFSKNKFSGFESEYNYFLELINKAKKLSKEEISDIDAINKLGEGWVAEETLAIAIYSCLKHIDSFEDTIICAVNHSGDSDSTGAVAGNIIGAYSGYDNIPSKYLEKLELKDLILELSEDMININNSENVDKNILKKYI